MSERDRHDGSNEPPKPPPPPAGIRPGRPATEAAGAGKHAARTTIVGGQPPGNARDLESVPVGIEQLLGMAAVDADLAARLREDRQNVIEGSGVELTPTERAVLSAIDDATLAKMIAKVGENLADPDRRQFLSLATGALALLAGGGALAVGLAGCDDKTKRDPQRQPVKVAGIRPDEHQHRVPAPTGSRPDRPPEVPAGVRPDRPTSHPTATPQPKPTAVAGATADPPPTRKPQDVRSVGKGGVRADRPIGGLMADTAKDDDKKKKPKRPGKSRGIRPDRPRPTRGIRPDRPKGDINNPFED